MNMKGNMVQGHIKEEELLYIHPHTPLLKASINDTYKHTPSTPSTNKDTTCI